MWHLPLGAYEAYEGYMANMKVIGSFLLLEQLNHKKKFKNIRWKREKGKEMRKNKGKEKKEKKMKK